MSIPEKVGPQFVARNPGFLLDLINSLERDVMLRPSRHGRLVDPRLSGEVCKAEPLGVQKLSKGNVHGGIVAQLATEVKGAGCANR